MSRGKDFEKAGDKAREIEVSWCQDNRDGSNGEGSIETGKWLWPPLKIRAEKRERERRIRLQCQGANLCLNCV